MQKQKKTHPRGGHGKTAAPGHAGRSEAKAAKAEPSPPEAADAEADDLDEDEPEPSLRRVRMDDGTAFMPDPEGGPAHIDDVLAESLAEEFLESATRGEDAVEDTLEAVVPEEIGGPFIETSAADEFAHDIDAANPVDAEAEPLPRPVAGLVMTPGEPDDDLVRARPAARVVTVRAAPGGSSSTTRRRL